MIKKLFGFTLLELLIAILIVGILTSIGYASYSSHVLKAKRADGQVALLQLAGDLERYYIEHNSYAGATLSNVGSSKKSPEGYYQLAITSANQTSFSIKANPLQNDPKCGALTYNNLGQKGNTGNIKASVCW